MSHQEFDLISQYFHQQKKRLRHDVVIGPGDDGAVLMPPENHELVVSIDSFVAGTHFFESTSAADIGYKSVAVSLSDMAAMGAQPAWLVLALTIPTIDHHWLSQFSKGLFGILDEHHVSLVGGDLTQGPLSISTHATGFVPVGRAITRAGAKVGDDIYVTGPLGGAGYVLQKLQRQEEVTITGPLHRPTPRVAAGLILRDHASAAIDISDGLAADLQHILQASEVGATLQLDAVPLAPLLSELTNKDAQSLALTAGEDYELCFTAPPDRAQALTSALALICTCSKIGKVTSAPGLRVVDQANNLVKFDQLGYQHF